MVLRLSAGLSSLRCPKHPAVHQEDCSGGIRSNAGRPGAGTALEEVERSARGNSKSHTIYSFPPGKWRLSVARIPALLRLELVTEEVIGNAGPQQGAGVLIGAEVDSSINARIRDVIGDLLES